MSGMNDQIRQSVRVELARMNMTQSKLADDVGISRQYVSDLMRAKTGDIPDAWNKILGRLNLKLVAIREDGGDQNHKLGNMSH